MSSSEKKLPADGTVDSGMITDGTIVNADINASAAIVGSKLDLSSPGAIGGTSPSTGAFTTASVTGDITTTNQTAPGAGAIGEELRSAVASGSAITLSNGAPKNITSVALTAGVWDVTGWVNFSETGSNMSGGCRWIIIISASTDSNTEVVQEARNSITGDGAFPDDSISDMAMSTMPIRIVVTSTTSYYLNANAFATTNFGVDAYGTLRAVRVA